MFSRTVMSRNKLWFCGTCTRPASRICRGLLPTSGSPRNVMLPRRGRSSPLMVASRVDLPAPFGPTTQVIPPSATVIDTSCSTSPPPYPETRPSTTRAGSPGAGIVVLLRDAEIGVENPRVAPDDRGCPGRDHGPVVQHRDVAAQAHHEVHVVLHDEEGLARLVELPDPPGEVLDERRVHPAGRLVEQHDRGIRHQNVGQLEQLALPVGQRVGERPGVVGDAGELQQLDGTPPLRAAARPGQRVAGPTAAVLRGDEHVLQHGQPGEDPGELEGPADAEREHPLRRPVRDLLVAEVDVAGVDPLVPGHDVEQGRLARSVRPDQAGDRALLDLDRAVLQRLDAAESLGHALGPEQGGHGAACPARPGCPGCPACPGWGTASRAGARRRRARSASIRSAAVGITPRGRPRITARNSTPSRISLRYSLVYCSVSHCWVGSMISAPSSGPESVPSPPKNAITTTERSNSGSKANWGMAWPMK